MGLFKNFTISNDNLILTENMFWGFNENNQNTIKEWTFESVENIKEINKFLIQLVEYNENCEIALSQNEHLNVKILSLFNDFTFDFNCKKYTIKSREYSKEELIEIINNMESHSIKNYERLQQLNFNIDEFKNFVNNEIIKKNIIINSNTNNESKIRSEIELNLLKKIIAKFSI